MSHPPKICEECGKEFIPKIRGPQRTVCFKPACIAAKDKERNLVKMERVRQLRATGEWKKHKRRVKGIGRGNGPKTVTGEFRTCLRCGHEFEVPKNTDWHICLACHAKNDRLLKECLEGALGIEDSLIREPDSLGNGGRRRRAA